MASSSINSAPGGDKGEANDADVGSEAGDKGSLMDRVLDLLRADSQLQHQVRPGQQT